MRVREYLSWSQMDSFERGYYIKNYLSKKRQVETPYQKFGKEVHEALESDESNPLVDKIREFLPAYIRKEVKIETKIEGIPILGIIDGLNARKKEFGDYKTSKAKWTQKKADSSGQITFYYVLLWKEYGWLPKKALIHWIETKERWTKISLTGNVKTFETKREMKDIIAFYIRMKKSWVGIEKLVDKELTKNK